MSRGRMFLVVFGIVLLLSGTVWAFQGLGKIPGSFMSNDLTWTWIGAVTAAVGLAIVIYASRAGRSVKKA